MFVGKESGKPESEALHFLQTVLEGANDHVPSASRESHPDAQ